MLELWLVDGYNLLHDLKPPKRGKKPAKETLFDLLADFASAADDRRVLLVLDGKGKDAEHDYRRTRAFSAVYAQEVTADTFIEKTLYDNRSKAKLYVVTGDRAISQMARGGGAFVFSPAIFMETVLDVKKGVAERIEKDGVRTREFNRPFDQKFKEKGL